MHRNLRVQFSLDDDKVDSKSGTLTINYNAGEVTDTDGNYRRAENWRYSERVDLGDQKDRQRFFGDCARDFKSFLAKRKVERSIEADLESRMLQILETDDPAPESKSEALQAELHAIELKLAKGEIDNDQAFTEKEAAHELFGANENQNRQLQLQKARVQANALKADEDLNGPE